MGSQGCRKIATAEAERFVATYRCFPSVFVLPPWREIYRTDAERVQTCHLGCRATWVARDALAALFWSERDNAGARSNLRRVILQVQKFE